jgi:hypothetical protein
VSPHIYRLILKTLLCLFLFLIPNTAHSDIVTLASASTTAHVEPLLPQVEVVHYDLIYLPVGDLEARIRSYSSSVGVSEELAVYIAKNESHFNPNATGDLHLICARTGSQVYARGLFQITRCYHPEVSDAQAYNPDFAIPWAVNLMKNKQVCMQQFSTCRDYYNLH